jgi:hypothetical protein
VATNHNAHARSLFHEFGFATCLQIPEEEKNSRLTRHLYVDTIDDCCYCLNYAFISSQIKPVVDNFPAMKQNISSHLVALSAWFSEKTNISMQQQTVFINDQSQKLLDYTGSILGGIAGSLFYTCVFRTDTYLHFLHIIL